MAGTHYNSLPRGYRLGRFEIEGVLGEGGFGITYKAWDTKLEQPRAIKEYLPGEFAVRIDGSIVRAKSDAHVETFTWGIRRFLKEAQTLARFDHPNIVRVLDFFEQNDTAYMVMDYYDGESLQQRIREGRAPKTEAEILALVRPLLQGLSVVHASNILHLDIKPANIYIWHDRQVPVLLDFGAARELIAQHSRSAASVYTPGYAAVEQYHESGKRGPWTDIYGMGATLYTLIAGVQPEEAPGRVEEDAMKRATDVGRGRYSPGFLAAIDASLAVFGKDRPRTCADWEAMLTRSGIGDTRREQRGAETEQKTVRWDAPTVVSADRRRSVSPAALDRAPSRERDAVDPMVTRPSGPRATGPGAAALEGTSSPGKAAGLHDILGQVSNEEQARAAAFRKILEEAEDRPRSTGTDDDDDGQRSEEGQRKKSSSTLRKFVAVLFVAAGVVAFGVWGYRNRFIDNRDGTISDPMTGIMWEKMSDDGTIHDKDNTYSWADAAAKKIAALNSMRFAGHNDWRLPTKDELETLVDKTSHNPAIWAPFRDSCKTGSSSFWCSCTQSGRYWSSTTYQSYATFAWFVNFYDGYTNALGKTDAYYVRAVRNWR